VQNALRRSSSALFAFGEKPCPLRRTGPEGEYRPFPPLGGGIRVVILNEVLERAFGIKVDIRVFPCLPLARKNIFRREFEVYPKTLKMES
jgi:hypothetical protein